MTKERYHLTRRSLLKLTTAPLLAPLAAACAPFSPETPATPKISATEKPIKNELTPETVVPTLSLKTVLPTVEPSPIVAAVTIKPDAPPTPKPDSTPKPTRPRVEVPELTHTAQEREPLPASTEQRTSGTFWTKEVALPGGAMDPIFFTDKERVFTFNANGYLEAHDLSSGKLLWQWQNRNAKSATYLIDEFDPFLYAESLVQVRIADFQILHQTLDRKTGKQLWSVLPSRLKLPGDVDTPDFNIRPGVLEGYMSRGDGTEYFFLFDKKTGKILWEGEGDIKYVLPGENIAVITTSRKETDKSISTDWFTTDLKTGESRRKVFSEYTGNLISRFYFEDTVLYAELNVYKQGIGEYSIAAIDIKSSQKLWEFASDKPIEYKSFIGFPIIQHPARVYLRAESFVGDIPKNTIMAVDKRNGQLLWSLDFDIPKRIGSDDFHADVEDTLIFSDREQGITAGIDSANGKLLWQHKDFVFSSIRGSTKGMIVATNGDKNTSYGIDVKTGKVVWSIPTAYSLSLSGTKIAYFTPTAEVSVLDIATGKTLHKLPIKIEPSSILRFATNDIVLVYNKISIQKGILTAFKV